MTVETDLLGNDRCEYIGTEADRIQSSEVTPSCSSSDMGIKNFQTYVETFFGLGCFGEFNVQDASYRVRDFSRYELRGTPGPSEADTDYDGNYDRCGVYIDLSSYIYGRVRRSFETTDTFAKMMSSVDNGNEKKTVVCELDRSTIDRIVEDCKQSIVSALEPLLLKAYRVYLAYDTFQPKAKFFEQSRRRRRTRFSLGSASREACFDDIVKGVKDFIVQSHLKTAREHVTNNDAVNKAIESKLFPSDATRSAFGEGEWKCFYRIYRDINDRVVDTCYVFGRDWDIGLAMTMYQHPARPEAIKYVYGPNDSFEHRKLFDEKERMLHFVCLAMFGNDYVGGLVNLSNNNAALVKKELDKMCDGEAGACTSEQVEYLSGVLFTRDDLTISAEEEEDADKRRKLSRAFATVVARFLAAVYGNTHALHPDMVEDVLHYADIGPFATRPGPNENARLLRKYLADRRRGNEENLTDRIDPDTVKRTGGSKTKMISDENTMLTCMDACGNRVARTLQQCMDSFALSVLWYLSYTTFYFRSPSGRDMMGTARSDKELPMNVGMCMSREATFRYNDARLSSRFDLHRLLELKRVLENINFCRLYWIIEGAFDNAFESK